MSDEKMIKKAKKGNEKAFSELIQGEKDKLFRMAYLYVKNESDALDIVQETIYKAFISIKKLKEPNYFSTWLTKILIHTALDFIKKNNRTIPFSEVEVGDSPNEQPPELDDSIDLKEAIERLEEQYKTVVVLKYYRDLTVKQIAEMLKCPEGTVKTNLHRAVNQLKSDLRKECIQ